MVLVVVHSPRYLSAVMEQQISDTIAAICTAPGEAGIAIVRISGPDSLRIADAVFRSVGDVPSRRPDRTLMHGHVHRKDREDKGDADEVILLIYRAPHSYTREDVVEIQGHGGRHCGGRILRCVLEAGARSAEPGEFTRRAFLNGRIDLLQAEAVLDLIRARSDRAASAALEQLDGNLSNSCTEVYDILLCAAADLEALLDFPEDEQPEGVTESVEKRVAQAVSGLKNLLATWEEGHVLRDGALVVIAGRPNVGKSTLLNRMLGTDRAIVAETPGTTRDTIEEQVVIRGIPMRLVDTAGMRESDCGVEKQGVERARESVRNADLVLQVIDASQALDSQPSTELVGIESEQTLIVLNKVDLGQLVTSDDFPGYRSCTCSLLRGDGLDELREAIVSVIGINTEAPPHTVISERHRSIIQSVLIILNDSMQLIATGGEESLVLVAATLRSALENLGSLTGRVYSEELLDSIFSRFCLGK